MSGPLTRGVRLEVSFINQCILSLFICVEIGMGTKCVIDMEGNQTILDSQRCSLIRNSLFLTFSHLFFLNRLFSLSLSLLFFFFSTRKGVKVRLFILN